jgi:mRNA-degrading endonuclease RelE of RelBE toxin-antitoxin system
MRPFDRPVIQAAVTKALAGQPEIPTRNRRPLAAPLSWCPEATWQLRVGAFRVLFRMDEDTVHVLRVVSKGLRTSEEMEP